MEDMYEYTNSREDIPQAKYVQEHRELSESIVIEVAEQLRSTYATSLDVWHLSEEFTSLPTLSGTFIEDPTGTVIDRVIAVQDEPQFILDSFISCKCVRPMPMYSIPGLIDHF